MNSGMLWKKLMGHTRAVAMRAVQLHILQACTYVWCVTLYVGMSGLFGCVVKPGPKQATSEQRLIRSCNRFSNHVNDVSSDLAGHSQESCRTPPSAVLPVSHHPEPHVWSALSQGQPLGCSSV